MFGKYRAYLTFGCLSGTFNKLALHVILWLEPVEEGNDTLEPNAIIQWEQVDFPQCEHGGQRGGQEHSAHNILSVLLGDYNNVSYLDYSLSAGQEWVTSIWHTIIGHTPLPTIIDGALATCNTNGPLRSRQALINDTVTNVMQTMTDFNHTEVVLLTGTAGLMESSHHFIDLIVASLRGNTPLQDENWYGSLCICSVLSLTTHRTAMYPG